MLADLVSIVFGGLIWGMATFLVASGLTLIFGILHILNFAQGGFFMLGAFMASTLVTRLGDDVSIWSYLGVSVVAAAGVAVLGLITDALVFRRLRGVPDIYVLIATYALLLLTIGAAKLIWGADPLSVAPPRELGGLCSSVAPCCRRTASSSWEPCRSMGDDGLRRAAYRGGWKPA